jgi:hypothetical protein
MPQGRRCLLGVLSSLCRAPSVGRRGAGARRDARALVAQRGGR